MQNLIHVLSIVIQQNCEVIVYFVVYFTYMFVHMSVTTHTCNFLLQLYMAALAYVRVGSL